MAADSRHGRLRRGLLLGLLWTGLVLCVFAVVRYWDQSRVLLQGLGGGGAVLMTICMVSIWVLTVASWRQVMHAYGGAPITTTVAARHLALLLLGKYLPGGVWGFIARLSDSASQRPLASMFAAGIAEQWLGLVSMSVLAALGVLAAREQQIAWLWMAALAPVVAVATLVLMHRCLHLVGRLLPSRWPRLQALPTDVAWNQRLWKATVLTVLQQALILGVVVSVATPAFALDVPASVAVAGCYGLSVVAGVLVVFVPGGILVREAVFVTLSSHWLEAGQAIALAAGLRLVFTVFDLLAGILASGLQLRRTLSG